MNVVGGAYPIPAKAYYTGKGKTSNLEWHRTTRIGVVKNRTTVSYRLPPKWLAGLGFKSLAVLGWQV